MIAADDDRGFQFSRTDQRVHGKAELRAFSVTRPADPGRQPLEAHAFSSEPNPAQEIVFAGEHFTDETVGAVNVRGISGQRNPAKWPLAFAKHRPDILQNKTGNPEGVVDPGFLGKVSDII